MNKLCIVEVQLIMQMLPLPCLLRLAQCNHILQKMACSRHALKSLPPLNLTFGLGESLADMNHSFPVWSYSRLSVNSSITLSVLPHKLLSQVVKLNLYPCDANWILIIDKFQYVCPYLQILEISSYHGRPNFMNNVLSILPMAKNLFKISISAASGDFLPQHVNQLANLISDQHNLPKLSTMELDISNGISILKSMVNNPRITSLKVTEIVLRDEHDNDYTELLIAITGQLKHLCLHRYHSGLEMWAPGIALTTSLISFDVVNVNFAMKEAISVNQSIKVLKMTCNGKLSYVMLKDILLQNHRIETMIIVQTSGYCILGLHHLLQCLQTYPLTHLVMDRAGGFYVDSVYQDLVELLQHNQKIKLLELYASHDTQDEIGFLQLIQNKRCIIYS